MKACILPSSETIRKSEQHSPESLRKSTYYIVDEFKEKPIEGQETIVLSDICNKSDASTFLKA